MQLRHRWVGGSGFECVCVGSGVYEADLTNALENRQLRTSDDGNRDLDSRKEKGQRVPRNLFYNNLDSSPCFCGGRRYRSGGRVGAVLLRVAATTASVVCRKRSK